MIRPVAGVLAKAFSLPLLLGLVDQDAGDDLGAGHDQPGVGIPHPALDHVLLDQRELLLDLGRS